MYIIYRPKGKAAEYSPWAANFYNGCSNRCETILTKRKEVVEYLRRLGWDILRLWTMKRYLKVGFTLIGRDDLEPWASTNAERIEAMKTLYSCGIYTWTSIEPVIDINASMSMIACSAAYCREYRIGLLSGKKSYTPKDVAEFKDAIDNRFHASKIVWKNSVLKYIEKETNKTRKD